MTLKPARLQWSEDGTLKSLDFDDVYFQSKQGAAESDYVFLQCNQLPARFATLESGAFSIAELGFGSGLNFLMTADLWAKTAPQDARLHYISIEKHPIEKNDLAKIYATWPTFAPFTQEVLAQYPPMVGGFHHLHFPEARIRLTLILGDVAQALPDICGKFDAWYLDGFTPSKNPDMWKENLFPLIAKRTAAGGTLSTFSAAGDVRRGLKAAGFEVKKTKGFGYKWHMTTARFSSTKIQPPPAEKITILGAGLAGCSAAYALAQKGFRVTVIDRHDAYAQETSGNPVGVLYPRLTLDESPLALFYRHGFCYTRALLMALKIPSWTPCGVLHLDLNEEDAVRSKALIERNDYPPSFAHVLDNVFETTGIVTKGSGLYQPLAGHVSPREFCAALLAHDNIETVYSTKVSTLEPGITIIALGNDSIQFSETSWMPLQSLRGQISYFEENTESRKLKTIICHGGYITPAISGTHCIGATFQKELPAAATLRPEDHAENLETLTQNIPEIGLDLKISGGRAGYRAVTPDKLPLIGPCPNYTASVRERDLHHLKNLYVTTGFGAHGLSSAPLAGEILACMIAGDPLPIPQSLLPWLLPERYIRRGLKRNQI